MVMKNMLSIHIDTDYSGISPYPVLILLSFAVGIAVMYLLNRKSGIERRIAGYLSFLAPMMSICGGFTLTYISTNGKGAGLSSIGGLVGMYGAVITMALIIKDRIQGEKMLRSCTLVLPLMYSISKTGCLFAGCCHGIGYHGPLCIEYTGERTGDICVFPVQLAETAVFLGIFVTGAVLIARRNKHTTKLIAVVSLTAKFGLDFLRESHTEKIITFNQVLCIALAVTALAADIAYNRGIVFRKTEIYSHK